MNRALCILTILLFSCFNGQEKEAADFKIEDTHHWFGHEVVVSAYNSVSWQTQGDPTIAAWGDTLKPGMKCIAVSRDLLKMGLKHNTMVLIDTFPDTFWVKDKMNRRWENRIDIYMGNDVKKARAWGKQHLDICYAVPVDTNLTQ